MDGVRAAHRIKVLWFDGTGLVLVYKLLAGGRFAWPAVLNGVIRLTRAQFAALFEGLDWCRAWSPRLRRPRIAPLVKEFGTWLKRQRIRVSAKSRLGEKRAYIGNHWDGLQVFLTDCRVEMDSNIMDVKAQGISASISEAGWPAAMASEV